VNITGGKITCIFGSAEINLTNAKLSSGYNVINLFCLFGGATFIVPSDWEVKTDVTAIFGGFTDKRIIFGNPDSNNNKTLLIKGLVLFGGGELKNVPQK